MLLPPLPDELEIPTILENMSNPCIRAYPPETVIAEKFHAMVALGMINSRMKDYYDLWYIAKSMEFDFNLLKEAISNTFKQRKTLIPIETPIALMPEFSEQKQTQWAVFLKKNQIGDIPANLHDVIIVLTEFFGPMIGITEKTFTHWFPNTGWKEK